MDITTTVLLAAISLMILYLIYNWLFASWDYWTSRGIPSVPGTVPIFGNTLSVFRLQENMSLFCTRVYQTYRDRSMVGFYNLTSPVLMVKDPELVKTVLQSSFNNFQHNESTLDTEIDPLLGLDPFFTRDQAWRESRATFATALTPKRIKNMAQGIAKVCKKLEDYLAEKMRNRDHYELDAKILFSRYTAEVSATNVFSIDGNSFADDYRGTLLHSMKTTMDPSKMKALMINILFFLPALGKFIKTRFVPSKVDRFFRNVAKSVENARKNDDAPRNDALQVFLDLAKSGKIPMNHAIAHSFSFFIESYETSSLTLGFLSYIIAAHQDIQSRLRQEIETVLAKHEGRLTFEAISEMNYLEQVLNEALRVFPAVGNLPKVCTERFRLEGSDGLTMDVEPGTTVIIPVLGLHMDPKIWKSPEEFRPERFSTVHGEGWNKFAHLPFGQGPRACPGQRLGVLQVKAAIATVIRKYHLELSPKMREPVRVDPRYFMLTAVGGYWIRLRPLRK